MTSQRRTNLVCKQLTLETHYFYQTRVVPTLNSLAAEKSRRDLAPSGYELLFGPPRMEAEVMFIGFQPGGGPSLGLMPQPAERSPMWPRMCEYADRRKNYNLAEIIRAIFPVSFLERCTASERNFFRAKDDKVYGAWPYDLRRDVEAFCLERLRTLIGILQPKRLVFFGKRATRDLMTQSQQVLVRENGHFLLDEGLCLGIRAMACRHLSGGWLKAGELDAIGAKLRSMAELT